MTTEKAVPRRMGGGRALGEQRVDESDPHGCGWRCEGGMCVATRRGDEAAVPKGTVQAAVSRLSAGGQ